VQQIATPAELYEHPRNRFVADFIGKVNLFDASVLSQRDKTLTCTAKGLGQLAIDTDKSAGGTVTIAVRPEKLKISKARPSGRGAICVNGKVRDVAYFGDTSQVVLSIPDGIDLEISVQNDSRTGGAGVERGQTVWAAFNTDDALVLTE
jgi:ABC-type Fe3+/spermidine/putrescine transport system ATPase subunit